MEDIETIRSVIDLDFVPDECIADSVNLWGDMFPQFFTDNDDMTAGMLPAMSKE